MAQAPTDSHGTAERLAVALVLDRPVSAANEDKLARLVGRLADADVAHITLVADGAIYPAAWTLGLKPLRRVEIGTNQSAQHFSGEKLSLTVLPCGSGRMAVVAAARLSAQELKHSPSLEEFDAGLREVAGPPPDLIIVTGGSPNLHGSFTWGAAYGEFVFCERSWTELSGADLDRAREEFAARGRRFGGIG